MRRSRYVALDSKKAKRYAEICEAFHAGFSLSEIKVLISSRITLLELEAALDWEREQLLVRSEIVALYDAIVATRRLRKRANLVLDVQYTSIMAKTRRFAIKEVQELIDAELGYWERIRALKEQVDEVSGHAGLGSLPAGIFTEDLEPDGGDGDS